MKKKLIQQVQSYSPLNEQEQTDKASLLRWLLSGEEICTRENLTAHLTASAWVVDPGRNKVLMAYHKLYDSWAWLGGHADGNWDLASVAEKEAREESSIETLHLVSSEPVSLEILTVNGHEKKGRYVPCHLHLNLTYLFEADPGQALQCKPDENAGVAWLDMDRLGEFSSEPWFVERIYSKLVAKSNIVHKPEA